ncbi:MAG TPA: PepSY domain-containing protein [Gammaproteobacteria bacterium]|nr:PepSY domain-containing protein [Gammaproteobacteria bacterium]
MTHPSRHKRKKKWHSLYIWHRYVGLLAALLTLLLAVTGLALNHYTALGLGKRHIQNEWLLDKLNITAPATANGFRSHGHQAVLLEPWLWLDNKQIAGEYSKITGLVSLDGMLILSTPGELQILTMQGELIDRLRSQDGLPNAIRRIGRTESGRLVIENPLGQFQADQDILNWTSLNVDASWSRAFAPDATTLIQLQLRWRHQSLSWGRLILKLHSGRILGDKGVLIMDGAAILLLFLSVSGFWIWLRVRLRKNKKTR